MASRSGEVPIDMHLAYRLRTGRACNRCLEVGTKGAGGRYEQQDGPSRGADA